MSKFLDDLRQLTEQNKRLLDSEDNENIENFNSRIRIDKMVRNRILSLSVAQQHEEFLNPEGIKLLQQIMDGGDVRMTGTILFSVAREIHDKLVPAAITFEQIRNSTSRRKKLRPTIYQEARDAEYPEYPNSLPENLVQHFRNILYGHIDQPAADQQRTRIKMIDKFVNGLVARKRFGGDVGSEKWNQVLQELVNYNADQYVQKMLLSMPEEERRSLIINGQQLFNEAPSEIRKIWVDCLRDPQDQYKFMLFGSQNAEVNETNFALIMRYGSPEALQIAIEKVNSHPLNSEEGNLWHYLTTSEESRYGFQRAAAHAKEQNVRQILNLLTPREGDQALRLRFIYESEAFNAMVNAVQDHELLPMTKALFEPLDKVSWSIFFNNANARQGFLALAGRGEIEPIKYIFSLLAPSRQDELLNSLEGQQALELAYEQSAENPEAATREKMEKMHQFLLAPRKHMITDSLVEVLSMMRSKVNSREGAAIDEAIESLRSEGGIEGKIEVVRNAFESMNFSQQSLMLKANSINMVKMMLATDLDLSRAVLFSLDRSVLQDITRKFNSADNGFFEVIETAEMNNPRPPIDTVEFMLNPMIAEEYFGDVDRFDIENWENVFRKMAEIGRCDMIRKMLRALSSEEKEELLLKVGKEVFANNENDDVRQAICSGFPNVDFESRFFDSKNLCDIMKYGSPLLVTEVFNNLEYDDLAKGCLISAEGKEGFAYAVKKGRKEVVESVLRNIIPSDLVTFLVDSKAFDAMVVENDENEIDQMFRTMTKSLSQETKIVFTYRNSNKLFEDAVLKGSERDMETAIKRCGNNESRIIVLMDTNILPKLLSAAETPEEKNIAVNKMEKLLSGLSPQRLGLMISKTVRDSFAVMIQQYQPEEVDFLLRYLPPERQKMVVESEEFLNAKNEVISVLETKEADMETLQRFSRMKRFLVNSANVQNISPPNKIKHTGQATALLPDQPQNKRMRRENNEEESKGSYSASR